jgi:hypothetical protein
VPVLGDGQVKNEARPRRVAKAERRGRCRMPDRP